MKRTVNQIFHFSFFFKPQIFKATFLMKNAFGSYVVEICFPFITLDFKPSF